VLNRLLAATMRSERRLLSHASLPFGHSIIAMARRPGSSSRDAPRGARTSPGESAA
jgi:hypothetical protein